MHAEIAERKEEIAEICRRYRVARLEVFGSAARGTDFDPDTSDVDFLVEYGPPFRGGRFQQYMGLIQDLSDTLGRKVDVLRMDTIRNKYLQKAINESREVVFDQAT